MSLSLQYREQGESGPVILLLHGLFGSSANWGSVLRDLSQHYRVLVPDLRNHGQSPHSADVSYAAMAADVLALLDEHYIGRVILVGHSMGGKLAMHLALKHPQRISALVVVDTSPVAYEHDFEQIFEACEAVELDKLEKRTDADEAMAPFLPQRGVRAFLQQNLQRVAGQWRWRCNLQALRAGQDHITGFDAPAGSGFGKPVSFIHGTLSDYVTPEHEPTIKALFPNAVFCPVEGAGHWVYSEKPEPFEQCLRGFLGRLK